jgi:threonine/homoserine efflux transporter RhtA
MPKYKVDYLAGRNLPEEPFFLHWIRGLFFFFQPVVGTLLGWIILGESIGTTFWMGSALILTGVLLVINEKK